MGTLPSGLYTNDQLEQGVLNAMRDENMEAIEAILLVYACQDVNACSTFVDSLKFSLEFAKRFGIEDAG